MYGKDQQNQQEEAAFGRGHVQAKGWHTEPEVR